MCNIAGTFFFACLCLLAAVHSFLFFSLDCKWNRISSMLVCVCARPAMDMHMKLVWLCRREQRQHQQWPMYVKMRHRIRFADVPSVHATATLASPRSHTHTHTHHTIRIVQRTTDRSNFARIHDQRRIFKNQRKIQCAVFKFLFFSFLSSTRAFFLFFILSMSSHCRCRLVFNIGTKTDERHNTKKNPDKTNKRTTGNEGSKAKKKEKRNVASLSENCWTFLPSQLLTCILFPIFDFSLFFPPPPPSSSSYLHMTHTHRMQSPSGKENISYSLRWQWNKGKKKAVGKNLISFGRRKQRSWIKIEIYVRMKRRTPTNTYT